MDKIMFPENYLIHESFNKKLDEIKNGASNSAIKATVIEALSGLGFDRWVFGSESLKSFFGPATLASGQTWKWLLVYMGKGYFHIDPVIKHCRETQQPLFWDASQASLAADQKTKEFWKDVLQNGFLSGLSIPLRSPGGLNGIISIVSDRPLIVTKDDFEQNFHGIRLIGESMHIGVEKLMQR